jgi:hypothetical protein
LVTAIARLFPRPKGEVVLKTPTANLGKNGAPQHPDKRKAGGHGPTLEDEVTHLLNVEPDAVAPNGLHSPAEWWNEFAAAIHRWETLRGTPAPVPIEQGPRGGIKLAPAFAEWMMGLPAGWVTGVPELTRGDQLARIGNGVVPQQAFAAFRSLLDL